MRTNPYPLTKEHVAFYQEHGYVRLHGMLDAGEVAALRAALDRAVGERRERLRHTPPEKFSSEYERVFTQMVNLWLEYEDVRPFVTSPRLAEVARRLVRSPSVALFHDHALIKSGNDSRPTPWHQDLPYWPMRAPGALSIWIALDDVFAGNGCLQFLPGSHRYGTLAPISLTDPQDLFAQVGEEARTVAPAVMEMPAGSCTFHDGRTFHHAAPNTSGSPRRALAIIYIPAGVTYDASKPHCVTDGTGLADGGPFTGERFPILAREP